ncbi:hypothetical protein EVAR_39454_1 [Eumeta japonica]|uniref:Uncharacterized protein n=1 Tax=Eumeta variegata TaxID=151549 RepID=A0A4C1VYU7_EUMVA|nr:hypothetical protein EVAR_39454_1 [Eumeta japonica]
MAPPELGGRGRARVLRACRCTLIKILKFTRGQNARIVCPARAARAELINVCLPPPVPWAELLNCRERNVLLLLLLERRGLTVDVTRPMTAYPLPPAPPAAAASAVTLPMTINDAPYNILLL